MRQDPAKWHPAFQAEIDNILENGTLSGFTATPPKGATVIDLKILGKSKYDAFGNWEKNKGRVVAKGYQQPGDIETFAPTSAASTTRVFLSLAASLDLEVHQLDFTGAFLNAKLEPGTWVRLPAWGNQYLPAHLRNPTGGPVYAHLEKALYGLKEAPRAWHKTLLETLRQKGYENSPADAAIYVRISKDGRRTWLLVFVDDVLVAAERLEDVEAAKAELLATYKGTDKGEARSFLGMSIERDRAARTITLGLESFTTRLVERFGMAGAPAKSTPLAAGIVLTKEGTPLDTNLHQYSALVGSLNYLACYTRPDLSQAVRALSRYQCMPTADHWAAALGVLSYLKGTAHLKLHLGGGSTKLLGYSDADWAGDVDSRLSTTGWVFLLGGAAISWSSKRQELVATSTAESEFTSLATAAREALWLRTLLQSLGVPRAGALEIKCDSTSAIAMAKDPILTARNKHYDVKLHFIRQRIARGEICVPYVPSKLNLADPLTKPVPKVILDAARTGWGLR